MSAEDKLDQNDENVKGMPPGNVQQPTEKNNSVSEASEQLQIEIQKQQPEEMEVHHHPKVEKKNFKEYFLEFVMIFLAVTMGFFAENIRENITEHRREKEYARLLLSDLRSDSLYYVQREKKINRVLPDYDKLFRMLTQPSPVSNYKVLETFLPLGYTFKLEVTPTTYNEMKTSGTLRYIENRELRKKLQDYYDVKIPKAEGFIQIIDNFFTQYIQPYYVDNIRSQDWDFRKDSLVTATPEFENRNKASDQRLANIMWNYGHLLEAYVRTEQIPAADEGKKLMDLLKEKYHLRNSE